MSLLEGVQTLLQAIRLAGCSSVAICRLARRPREIQVAREGLNHPLWLRLRTTDVSVFEEIIVNSEYHFEYAGEPRTIVDAGANIGLTSVFFANRFPQARIFAIEPEAQNFEMLKKNTGAYPISSAFMQRCGRNRFRLT